MNAIIQSISFYYEGLPSKAYEFLNEVFLKDDRHLLNLIPQFRVMNLRLYRVRKDRDFRDRKDLFHVPFDKREYCGTYRYSIIGVPSLYLAESLETSLRETGIGNNNYSCSCFNNPDFLIFVDLTLPSEGRVLTFWERYSFVLFYPLIMACGLKVKKPEAAFKPEYVIPQLLFQVIFAHTTLDGVKYNSSKYENRDFHDSKQNNYVMFAIINDTESKSIYSDSLTDKLVSTCPISPNEDETTEEFQTRCLNLDFNRIY